MRVPLVIALVQELKSEYLKLGYTEDECIELEYDDTVDTMTLELQARGYEVVCVGHFKNLVACLSSGEAQKWDLVYNNSSGMYGSAREALVPSLLEAYQIPFTGCSAATMALCLDKAQTKMVLEHNKIAVAPFAVIPAKEGPNGKQNPVDMLEIIKQSRHHSALMENYPLFLKLNAEGSSKGIGPPSKIEHPKDLHSAIHTLQAQYPSHDLILETFLPGREFTVGIMGTSSNAKVLGTIEIAYRLRSPEDLHANVVSSLPASSRNFDFSTFSTKDSWDPVVVEVKTASDLANDVSAQRASKLALQAYQVIGCRDAARIDVRMDRVGTGAEPNIIEINPIYGIRPNWSHFPTIAKNAGMSYGDFIGKIVTNALERYHIS